MVEVLRPRVDRERDPGDDVADLGLVLDPERIGAVVEADLRRTQLRAENQVVDVPVADHRHARSPGGEPESRDLAHLTRTPARQDARTEDDEQPCPGDHPGQRAEHVGLGVQPCQRESDRGQGSGENPDDLDHADAAEIEPALEHRERHDPHGGDHERGGEQAEELGRRLAEQGRGHQRGEEEGREHQRRADDQGQHRRALDMGSIERLPLHQSATRALVGERQGELADDHGHRDAAEVGRGDEMGEEDPGRQRQQLGGDPGDRDPAEAGERRLSELAARDLGGWKRLVWHGGLADVGVDARRRHG